MKKEINEFKEAKNKAELEAKNKLKTDATTLVNKAHEEGRITKEEVESTIENASKDETNFKMVSNFLSKLPTKKTSQKPFDVKNVKEGKEVESRDNWTYRDWESKDLKGLQNMYQNELEKYNELLKTLK